MYLLIFLTLLLPPLSFAEDLKNNDPIIQTANSSEWLNLLHYKKIDKLLEDISLEATDKKTDKKEFKFDNTESYIDGGSFFISTSGKTSSIDELEATLNALRGPDSEKYRCNFPARFEFLKDKFNLQGDLNHCADLNEWLTALAPKSLSVIYADSFLNNPASLFGHTFLKLNSEKGAPLIDYIIQYHAAVGSEPGVIFAFKGIFGGYKGFFQLTPYYQSITKYNDYEQRDIWEYKLNLNNEELRRLLLHLWELREVPIDYYYFDENCSFHILSLLKVARPSLELYKELLNWIIPLDTLKVILKNEGLLSEVLYRPSRSSKLIEREKELKSSQRKLAKRIAVDGLKENEEDLNKYDEVTQAKILEASNEYFEYKNLRVKGSANLLDILGRRSKLPQREKSFEVPTPQLKPNQAHDSRRIGTERGFHSKKGVFISGEFRPAYHDLLDPSESFPAGSAIEAGRTKIRWTQSRGVELDKFSLLKINSYTPDTSFIKKYSWDLGVQFKETELSREGRAATFDIGFGKSFALNSQKSLLAILPRIKLESGGGAGDYAPGISATLLFELYDDFRVKLQHENYFNIDGENTVQYTSEISAFYKFYEDSGITFRAVRELPYGERGIMGMTGWQWYF